MMGAIFDILGAVVGVVVSTPAAVAASPVQAVIAAAVTAVVGVLAKKASNDTIENWIQAVVGGPCYVFGVTITLGLSKWKWSAGIWNKVVEAYVIDLLQHVANIPIVAVDNMVRGMKSDNNLKRSI